MKNVDTYVAVSWSIVLVCLWVIVAIHIAHPRVLMNVPLGKTHRAVQCTDRLRIRMCSQYVVFRLQHWKWRGVPHGKDLFGRFRKRIDALQPLQKPSSLSKTSFFVSGSQKWLLGPIPSSLCLIFQYCWNCSRTEYPRNICLWTFSNQLSVRSQLTELSHSG